MLSEPDEAGVYTLYGVNDLPQAAALRYTVRDVTDEAVLAVGRAVVEADAATPLQQLSAPPHHMLQFSWQSEDSAQSICGDNHYYTQLLDVSYPDYLRDLERCGYAAWEGFEER